MISSETLQLNFPPGTGFAATPPASPPPAQAPELPTGGRLVPDRHEGTNTRPSATTVPLSLFADSPSELVAAIRATFGLNVSELARTLDVERPTVYSWMAGAATPQPDNWHRLTILATFAVLWSSRGLGPMGSRVRRPLPGAPSLLDLLSRKTIQRGDVLAMLDALAAVPEVRGIGLRNRGIELFDSGLGQVEIDRLTGRPIPPESL